MFAKRSLIRVHVSGDAIDGPFIEASLATNFLTPLNVTLLASTAVIGSGVCSPFFSAQNPETVRRSKSTTTDQSATFSFRGRPRHHS